MLWSYENTFCVQRKLNLFMKVPWRMRMHSSACEQVAVHACFTLERWLLRQQHHMYASWYSCEWQRTDAEKKKSFNIVVILVFFEHKTYSHSFIKLRLNHWCHMDYFNNVFITFIALNVVVELHKKLSDFIKNILICVLMMNEALTVWNDMRMSN